MRQQQEKEQLLQGSSNSTAAERVAAAMRHAAQAAQAFRCVVAAMPPKLSDAQVDDKLVALREYVRDHLEELASRSSSCLKAVFARRQNYEEAQSYLFLYKHEARFTEAQRRYVHETFAMLAEHRGSSGGAHPVARGDSEALPMASAPRLSGNEQGERPMQEQSQSSGVARLAAEVREASACESGRQTQSDEPCIHNESKRSKTARCAPAFDDQRPISNATGSAAEMPGGAPQLPAQQADALAVAVAAQTPGDAPQLPAVRLRPEDVPAIRRASGEAKRSAVLRSLHDLARAALLPIRRSPTREARVSVLDGLFPWMEYVAHNKRCMDIIGTGITKALAVFEHDTNDSKRRGPPRLNIHFARNDGTVWVVDESAWMMDSR